MWSNDPLVPKYFFLFFILRRSFFFLLHQLFFRGLTALLFCGQLICEFLLQSVVFSLPSVVALEKFSSGPGELVKEMVIVLLKIQNLIVFLMKLMLHLFQLLLQVILQNKKVFAFLTPVLRPFRHFTFCSAAGFYPSAPSGIGTVSSGRKPDISSYSSSTLPCRCSFLW